MQWPIENGKNNKENLLFLTVLNYFRQILVALNYFVQSDWRTMVQNLELPYNVECDLDMKIA
jgi:hypothetical protein